MSTIRTNTLSNVAGTASTAIENAINGSAKAWVNFNGTGTVAIRDSYNVSSITDNGTGNYTVNFTTAMPNANYAMTGTAQTNATPTAAGWQTLYNLAAPAVSSCQVGTGSSSAGTDCAWVNVAVFR